ncbi:tyrosine-protein phosphatase non-receptor type 23 isoform X2 [Bradysia coprophila]|uniref:tyrosine-protein phosphatase non-receptor type 23 isoform X2 n=1 Tax=Bradysia coprophila TaxID=38358 RepID=UPI00187D7090|nr:tyrosine-protein phosphatase non-receptor type 23 isoform X2 [Bradysia coprophila]
MEALPKLPMVSFDLKVSTEPSSFGNLKRYIAECYQEDPDAYSKEIYALELLRNAACRPSVDVEGCKLLKRYYCQLHSIQSRFPLTNDRQLLSFSWRDAFSNSVNQSVDIRSDMCSILYNFGALHTKLGASEDRTSSDGVKLACTHFQCAAWAFGHLREFYPQFTNGDMSPEVLIFMQELCFAQAQECILEKSLADNRKPGIVAKVTAQIICYYNAAFSAMLNGGEDGAVADIIGSKNFKEWKRYVRFKISYLSCILLLYQGQQAEEQQKMGERVAFFVAAYDKMEEARKEAKGMSQIDQINETFAFLHDVVEGKRKSAKNENEFIYHEEVPNISTFSAVQGANLVKGIAFSVTDPEVASEDIFHRLIPMKAHEASSLYSEEKSTLLRKVVARVEDKDNELNQFMGSLNVESLRFNNAARLPQELVDRCAAINAKPNAIPDLVTSMSSLAEACLDVESMLKEIKDLLNEEQRNEKSYQQTMGVRPSGHFAELSREFVKYQEAHSKAGESNDTLRKAMGLHVNNLKTLAKPLSEVQAAIPICEETSDDAAVAEMNVLLSKVNEMRVQRAQLLNSLREAMNNDDITAQVIAWGDKKLEKLFKKELLKHEQSVKLLEQNLSAQTNILRALTDCYARCAPYIKAVVDTKHRRENFFSSLASSYDVYDDLLGKSSKGLEFYKKLQGNIQKLLARVKGAKDVQDEERQQRLKSTKPEVSMSATAGGPKLKDYLNKNQANKVNALPDPYVPSARSSLGPENSTVSTGNSINASPYQINYPQPNDPPPPYVPYGSYNNNNMYNPYPTMDAGQSTYNQPSPYNSGKTATENAIDHTGSANVPQSMYTQNATSPAPNHIYDQNSQQQQGFQANIDTSRYQFVGQSTQDQPTQNNQINYPYQGFVQPPPYSVLDTTKYQPSVSPTPSQTSSTSSGWVSQQPYSQNTQQTGVMFQQPQLSQTPNYLQNMHQSPVQQYQNQESSQNYQQQFQQPSLQQTQLQPPQYQQSQFQQPQFQQSQPQQPELQQPQFQQPQLHPQQPELQQDQLQQPQLQQPQFQQPQLHPQQPELQQHQLQQAQLQQPQAMQPQLEHPQLQEQQFQQPQLQNNSLQPNQQFSASSNIYSNAITSSNNNTYTDLYTTTSQSNYQITANNQYVTGYDQSGKIYSNQNSTSYGGHPGYTFNQNTGAYAYGSGYQDNEPIRNPYSQYTSAALTETSYTTDSNNLSTNGESFAAQYATDPNAAASYNQQPVMTSTGSYFNLPYGTTTFSESENANVTPPTANISQNFSNSNSVTLQPVISDNRNSTTYMQSNSQTSTTITSSGETRNNQQASHESSTAVAPPDSTKSTTQPSNIDLLSGLDFTISDLTISTPPLQPKSINDSVGASPRSTDEVLTPTKVASQPSSTDVPTNLKPKTDLVSSADNLSICSDLSSIDQNFDWESASQKNDPPNPTQVDVDVSNTKEPTISPDTVRWFHKEVERLEKTMESVKVKTLNGSTSLDSKWKDLQDLLVKDESKRTTSVAKLFPEKNRSTDNIPYDHARVLLPTSTDNYINAVYVQELSAGCPQLILAQTPLRNTVTDFWHMIWSQKSRLIVCLHSPTEMLDPFFPQTNDAEDTYDDFSVTVVKQFDLSHCIERNVKVTMHGSDIILDVTILQNKSWPKNSAANILGMAQNIGAAYRQLKLTYKETGPLILNCISGSERSGVVALAIAALTATNSKRPILINPIDVWYRICCQRKGALRDITMLELSMQIVLANAHNLLNKHGVMTSYQMKTTTPVTLTTDKPEVKDPFSDLDPLWKLKPKN